jgi:hypothetical protein
MRFRTVAALVVAVVALIPAALSAQPPFKVRITGVRVGFPYLDPDRRATNALKAGAWGPIYVDLAATGEVGAREAVVQLTAEDNADLTTAYRENVPAIGKDEQPVLITYARLANGNEEPILSLHDIVFGRTPETWKLSQNPSIPPPVAANRPAPPTFARYTVLPAEQFTYLTAGIRNSGIVSGIRGRVDPKAGTDEDAPDGTKDGRAFCYVTGAKELPTRWYGYNTVDVVVLHTGKNTQIISDEKNGTGLLEDKSNRKEALAEWVRRGGRLIVSVGSNHQAARTLLTEMKLIHCDVTGLATRPQMRGVMKWSNELKPFEGGERKDNLGEGTQVSFAKLENLGPDVEILARELRDAADPVDRPVIVQAGCGLGRVILVAFDLEKAPFTRWDGSAKFWERLKAEVEPPTRAANPNQPMAGQPRWGSSPYEQSNELTARLYTQLDTFAEVPVVSFGWVALFILIYIIIVGPLDYLFLTKVIKRPELTWITFPAVVIGISAIAYFTAYWMKGQDLRINKLDVVDIVSETDPDTGDSRSTALYGSTWFTLFSPRIQNYTVGVSPPENNTWVPVPLTSGGEPDEQAAQTIKRRQDYSTTVNWFGKLDESSMGGGPSLFRRTYDYAPATAGLEGVPIQVWTTKSFQASWQAQLTDPIPLIKADLSHPPGQGKDNQLIGKIESKLPVTLDKVELIYRNNVYQFGDRGELKRGTNVLDLSRTQPQTMAQWSQEAQALMNTYAPNASNKKPQLQWSALIRPLLFNDALEPSPVRNSLLRSLDQSWELKRPDEVVLIGKAVPLAPESELTTAEAKTLDPVSASQLWLGDLPIKGGKRPPLNGKMPTQETYVRIFLPVKPVK